MQIYQYKLNNVRITNATLQMPNCQCKTAHTNYHCQNSNASLPMQNYQYEITNTRINNLKLPIPNNQRKITNAEITQS